MMITVSAFKWVPPFAQGFVRDLRVRWALEEAGLLYQERLIDANDQSSTDYRALQPFGQVPTFEENGFALFESGSIVMHIAERSDVLMPADAEGRARAKTWMFAALNTIEPHVMNLADIDIFSAGKPWAAERRPEVVGAIRKRFKELAVSLGDKDYLEDRFTAADLLMTTVLRSTPDILAERPTLDAYRARCVARPAFQRAMDAQLAAFARHLPRS
jgi:glutathione S-transferase